MSPITLSRLPLRALPQGKGAIQAPCRRPVAAETSNGEHRTGIAEAVGSSPNQSTKELTQEIQQYIDTQSHNLQQTGCSKVVLDGKGEAASLERMVTTATRPSRPKDIEAVSHAMAKVDETFGIELGPRYCVSLGRMMAPLGEGSALDAAAKVRTRQDLRIAFDHKVEAIIQEIVDLDFDVFKRIGRDAPFGEVLEDPLLNRYAQTQGPISTEGSQ